jgi:hypothetical protein
MRASASCVIITGNGRGPVATGQTCKGTSSWQRLLEETGGELGIFEFQNPDEDHRNKGKQLLRILFH